MFWGSLALLTNQRFEAFRETSSSVCDWVLISILEPFSFSGGVLKWTLEPFWFSSRVSSFETLVLVVVAVYLMLFMVVGAEVNPFMASAILLRSCIRLSTLCNNFDGFIMFRRGSWNYLLNDICAIIWRSKIVVGFSTFHSDAWVYLTS